MKAVICSKYGPPESLKIEEIPKPIPKDDEVLVNVHATSMTYSNMMLITGKPFAGRLMGMGLFKPKWKIPGSDIAGRVEAVGQNTKQFKPGDEVYGDLSSHGRGGFAEYVCTPEKELGIKPANISFEEAAAVPEASHVALQALRDRGQIKKGQKVLIYGASGGIGTFAVQIAKYFGAEVTGVCSTGNVDLVYSIGADHAIDYTREDFVKKEPRYDLIVATAGFRSIFDYKRALSPNGNYVSTGGQMAQVFQGLMLGPIVSIAGKKKLSSMMVKTNKDLDFITGLIEAGHVKPVIDKYYPIKEVSEAVRYYGKGHSRGKVVITLESD